MMDDNLLKAGRLAFAQALGDKPHANVLLPDGYTLERMPDNATVWVNDSNVTDAIDAAVYETYLRLGVKNEIKKTPFANFWSRYAPTIAWLAGVFVGKFLP